MGVLVLTLGVFGFSGLSRRLQTSLVLNLPGLLKSSAFDLLTFVSFFVDKFTFGLVRANLERPEHGLSPTQTFSWSLICFNGVLVCFVGDTLVSSSRSFVFDAPLFDAFLIGVLAALPAVAEADTGFLLDLGVLRSFSGSSSMGLSTPLLLVDFGLVFSSSLETSSSLTGVTTLPALDLVLLWGRSSLV